MPMPVDELGPVRAGRYPMRIGSDCAIAGRKTPVASAAALAADPANALRRLIFICFLRMAYVFLQSAAKPMLWLSLR
jgi:hypothetical protein